jgi:predicted Zn-dependent peptidase
MSSEPALTVDETSSTMGIAVQTKHTFDNGLRLITAPIPHSRAVSMMYIFAAGGCYETEPESGISHFIEHLCFRGTEKRRT